MLCAIASQSLDGPCCCLVCFCGGQIARCQWRDRPKHGHLNMRLSLGVAGACSYSWHIALWHHHYRCATARLQTHRRRASVDVDVYSHNPCRGRNGNIGRHGQKSSVPLGDILLAVLFSCVAAFLALSLMMRWLRRQYSFTPYVIYRVILGLGLLGWPIFSDCVIAVPRQIRLVAEEEQMKKF